VEATKYGNTLRTTWTVKNGFNLTGPAERDLSEILEPYMNIKKYIDINT